MMAFPDGFLDTKTCLFYAVASDGLWYVYTVFDMDQEWQICVDPINIVGFISQHAAQCWAAETFEITPEYDT